MASPWRGSTLHGSLTLWLWADQPPPFYNNTFLTYRVSPLYIGQEAPTTDRLALFSRQLRETLSGGIVRGVELSGGQDEHFTSRAGALLDAKIVWLPLGSVLGITEDEAPQIARQAATSEELVRCMRKRRKPNVKISSTRLDAVEPYTSPLSTKKANAAHF